MTDKPKKAKKTDYEQQLNDLTADLQRTRADFENYRKRVDAEKAAVRQSGQASAVISLLPVIDNIERAISHMPEELQGNTWAQGIAALVKNLDKALADMSVQRIQAAPGTVFDPNLHDAIQVDEDAEGEQEVIAEELQAGYTLDGAPIRHAMVKVTRR